MKIKHIFICIFSACFIPLAAQDTLARKKVPRFTRKIVGVDVLNGVISTFADRKTVQGFVLTDIAPRWEAVVDFGFQKNTYQKNQYDAEAAGFYTKVGGQYLLVQEPGNTTNAFYSGLKIAGSFYKQEYKSVPVRGSGTNTSQVAYPATNQSSFWVEGVAGGRVQLFDTRLLLDMSVQPRFLVGGTKQEGLQPMIVPGFGKSSGKFTVGFSWNIAYVF